MEPSPHPTKCLCLAAQAGKSVEMVFVTSSPTSSRSVGSTERRSRSTLAATLVDPSLRSSSSVGSQTFPRCAQTAGRDERLYSSERVEASPPVLLCHSRPRRKVIASACMAWRRPSSKLLRLVSPPAPALEKELSSLEGGEEEERACDVG